MPEFHQSDWDCELCDRPLTFTGECLNPECPACPTYDNAQDAPVRREVPSE